VNSCRDAAESDRENRYSAGSSEARFDNRLQNVETVIEVLPASLPVYAGRLVPLDFATARRA
jgi:hypothetical protein